MYFKITSYKDERRHSHLQESVSDSRNEYEEV